MVGCRDEPDTRLKRVEAEYCLLVPIFVSAFTLPARTPPSLTALSLFTAARAPAAAGSV